MTATTTTAHAERRCAATAEALEPRTLLAVQPVGPEVRANTTTTGEQQTLTMHKVVASNAAGDFVVVWESNQFGPNGLLFGQRFNSGGGKEGGEFVITPFTHRGQYYASVAMDASGAFVVAWENRADPFRGIYSQRYNAQGVAQGTATQVSTEGAMVSVAMDADGDYVMAWEQQRPGDRDIVAQRFDAAGVAQGGRFFAHATGSDFQFEPAVATDAGGNFVIAWVESIDLIFVKQIKGRLFDSAGNPRSGDIPLVGATPPGIRWGQHRVAMDADGDFAVTWDAMGAAGDGDGYGVYARRFNSGGAALTGEFLVNTTTAGTQYQPDISMDAAGDFVVTWVGANLSGVTGQYFNSAGARVGGEFRIDSPASRGWFASVAMDYDGDFTVGWQSSQAGQGDDVYARRFAEPTVGLNTVAGQVFHDVNAEGVKDAGDPGLANWTVFHDANNNGQLDTSSFALPSRAVSTPLQPVSTRRFVGPAAGPAAGRIVRDVNVTINIQHPNVGDLTAWLVSPLGERAELFSHVGGAGDNFSNTTFDDASPLAINQAGAPFTGVFRTQNRTLSVFDGDLLGDEGYWMLEVQNAGGLPGTVLAWSLAVTYSEDSAVADAQGFYFLLLPAGTHAVREMPQGGWMQTLPAGDAPHTVTFAGGGGFVPGLDFGNAYPGTASGTVFEDTNRNGVQDLLELGLGDWTVYADLNSNGRRDPTEPSTTSSARTGYTLRGVPFDVPVSLAAVPSQVTSPPWELSVAPRPFTLNVFNPVAGGQDFGGFRRAVSMPRVTQVFVNGQNLTANAAFRAAASVDQTFGYPVPAGANQLRALPWVNGVNAVSIRFSEDVTGQLAQGDLVVRNAAGVVATSAFTYDAATRTGTWTLAAPVTQNKLRLFLDDGGVSGLDGEWNNGGDAYPSGDGAAGGDFSFRVNVLRGDATGDLQVNALDLADVRRRLGRRPGDGTTGAGAYNIFSDLTMDGVVNALDLAAARQRLGNRINNLPEPA